MTDIVRVGQLVEVGHALLDGIRGGAIARLEQQQAESFEMFNAEKDGKKFYVIPVRGMGLWDAIWGYVSIDENLKVDGIVFDHKGETPGLGGEITQDYFQNSFKGESVFDANGNLQGLKVVKGYSGKDNKDDGEVDAISGATLTGNGVTEMLVRGLKPYEKYLKSNKK